jgi:hypothetical protein
LHVFLPYKLLTFDLSSIWNSLMDFFAPKFFSTWREENKLMDFSTPYIRVFPSGWTEENKLKDFSTPKMP